MRDRWGGKRALVQPTSAARTSPTASPLRYGLAHMERTDIEHFAERYAAAWCSGDPARVAAHFSPDGSLTINDGTPAIGTAAITEAAQSFMTAIPDAAEYERQLAHGVDEST